MSGIIKRASEPWVINHLWMTIYGDEKIGKTSLANMMPADTGVVLDFNRGMHRSRNRLTAARITTWDEAIAAKDEIEAEGFNYVVIDTAGSALKCAVAYLAKEDSGLVVGGMPTPTGWGRVSAMFLKYIDDILRLNCSLITIAHIRESQTQGDVIKGTIDVQGASQKQILQNCDQIGRMHASEEVRWIDFNPRGYPGIDAGRIGKRRIPFVEPKQYSTFLSNLTDEIIVNINEYNNMNVLDEEVAAAIEEVEQLEVVKADPDAIERMTDLMRNAPSQAVRDTVLMNAKKLDLEWDELDKVFLKRR